MAGGRYRPLLTANQPGGSPIVDRNLQSIQQALDRVAQDGQDALDQLAGKAAVKQVASKDGSVIVNPKTGVGDVDLSVFEDAVSPGAVNVDLGTCGPGGITAGLPTTFLKITKNGRTYMIPAWEWSPPPPSDFPLTGLLGWWKSDTGVTADGSGLISAVADQSGHGNDLSFDTNKPLLVTPGSGLPYINYDNGATGACALSNGSFAWGTSYSVLIVVENQPGSNGRIVDWDYSVANRYIWAHQGVNWKYQQDDVGNYVEGITADSQLTYFLVTVDPSTLFSYQDTGATPSFAVVRDTRASLSPPATHGIRFGSLPAFSQNSLCFMWEAAVWDHVLTSTEKTQLCAYLAARNYT